MHFGWIVLLEDSWSTHICHEKDLTAPILPRFIYTNNHYSKVNRGRNAIMPGDWSAVDSVGLGGA